MDIYLFYHQRQCLVRFLYECYEKWRSLTFFCCGDLFRSSENLTFSLGYECFQLLGLVSKIEVKVTLNHCFRPVWRTNATNEQGEICV